MDSNDSKGSNAIIGAVLIILGAALQFIHSDDGILSLMQVTAMLVLFVVGIRFVWAYLLSLSNS